MHPQYQQRVISASTKAHNLYVQTLSELGIIGGLLMIGLIVLLLPGLRRGLQGQPEQWVWLVGVGLVVVHLGLDIDAEYPAVLALVAMGLGLIWRPREDKVGRSSAVPAGLAIVGLVLAAAMNQSQLARSQADTAQADGDYVAAADDYGQAHSGLVYNPAVLEEEGIDYYTLAVTGTDSRANLALALERARQAELQAPRAAQNYQLEGRVLQAQGNLTDAETAFRLALRLDPYNQPSYAQDLAIVLQAHGQTKAALAITQAMLGQYSAAVLHNRATDAGLLPDVISLYRYQAFLENKLGEGVTSAADTKTAARLAGSQ